MQNNIKEEIKKFIEDNKEFLMNNEAIECTKLLTKYIDKNFTFIKESCVWIDFEKYDWLDWYDFMYWLRDCHDFMLMPLFWEWPYIIYLVSNDYLIKYIEGDLYYYTLKK